MRWIHLDEICYPPDHSETQPDQASFFLSAASLFTHWFIHAATRALKSEWSRGHKGDQYRVSQAQQWGSGQVASNCCLLFTGNMLTGPEPSYTIIAERGPLWKIYFISIKVQKRSASHAPWTCHQTHTVEPVWVVSRAEGLCCSSTCHAQRSWRSKVIGAAEYSQLGDSKVYPAAMNLWEKKQFWSQFWLSCSMIKAVCWTESLPVWSSHVDPVCVHVFPTVQKHDWFEVWKWIVCIWWTGSLPTGWSPYGIGWMDVLINYWAP